MQQQRNKTKDVEGEVGGRKVEKLMCLYPKRSILKYLLCFRVAANLQAWKIKDVGVQM